MTEWDIGRPRPWDQLGGVDRQIACLRAAHDGDQLALDALVHDLTPITWHVARGCGLDAVRAEEVVEAVWLSLRRNLIDIREPRALVGWLVITTRREARRALPAGDEAGETGLPLDVASGWADLSERDRRLWAAFGRLSRRCQELLRLTALSGRAEYRVVAEALAMPAGSIGHVRGRCLALLRDHLRTEASASKPHTEDAPGPGADADPAPAAEQECASPGDDHRDQLISKVWRGIRKALGLTGPPRTSVPEDHELAGAAVSDVAQAYVDVLRVFDEVETLRLDTESRAGGSR